MTLSVARRGIKPHAAPQDVVDLRCIFRCNGPTTSEGRTRRREYRSKKKPNSGLQKGQHTRRRSDGHEQMWREGGGRGGVWRNDGSEKKRSKKRKGIGRVLGCALCPELIARGKAKSDNW